MESKRVAGSLAFSLALLAFSCDSGDTASTQPPLNGAGTSGKGGSSGTSSSSGGSSGSGVSGSSGSSGTSSSTGGSGTGGSATGGSTGAGGTSTTGVELVNPDGWVGGDPAVTTDNPLGIQGAWYGYGDGTSCADQQARGNPCSAGGCCISGATVVDSTFAKWGCGLGLSLNASGGDASTKSAYTGTARSFTFTITGDTGGQPLRIGFTQAADTTGLVSPYKEIPAFSTSTTQTVTFADATYPSWCSTNSSCMGLQGTSANPASSYDLQVQIPGGVAAASYNFCITSLTASP